MAVLPTTMEFIAYPYILGSVKDLLVQSNQQNNPTLKVYGREIDSSQFIGHDKSARAIRQADLMLFKSVH